MTTRSNSKVLEDFQKEIGKMDENCNRKYMNDQAR